MLIILKWSLQMVIVFVDQDFWKNLSDMSLIKSSHINTALDAALKEF